MDKVTVDKTYEVNNHFQDICSCGTILDQCRCFSPNKTINVIVRGCKECQHTKLGPFTGLMHQLTKGSATPEEIAAIPPATEESIKEFFDKIGKSSNAFK